MFYLSRGEQQQHINPPCEIVKRSDKNVGYRSLASLLKAFERKRKNDNDDGVDISLTNSPGMQHITHFFLLSCFFCEKVDVGGNLTEVQTLGLDKRVRDAAKILKDERLLARLSEEDMVAVKARYHKPCLTELYNKAIRVSKPTIEKSDDAIRDGIALQKAVEHIRNTSKSMLHVFKLSNLK